MKFPYRFAALIISACVMPFASAQSNSTAQGTGDVSKADGARLSAIAQANIAEVAAGKLAIMKSNNAEVKHFAQMMITDHSKGLDDTKAVAMKKNFALPTEPDNAHKKMAADMAKLSGATFDQQYVKNAGVADHMKVDAALKEDIASAQDADVKALAAKLEPIVAHHLEMAKALQTKTP